MPDFHDIKFIFCDSQTARKICVAQHYMKTYPQGSKVNVAMMHGTRAVGVCVLGYSSHTEAKVSKLVYGIKRTEYLEMQRLWISDDFGMNTESFCLARIFEKLFERYKLQCIVTHSGGCKDDCGIVYQSSGWLYFGVSECDDFYLTEKKEYKNVVAAMRFGRINGKGKTKQQIGFELFGPGEVVQSHRYLYLYPFNKAMRRRLTKISLPYPKTSAMFRRNQEWICGGSAGAAGTGETRGPAGSIPATSTIFP